MADIENGATTTIAVEEAKEESPGTTGEKRKLEAESPVKKMRKTNDDDEEEVEEAELNEEIGKEKLEVESAEKQPQPSDSETAESVDKPADDDVEVIEPESPLGEESPNEDEETAESETPSVD